MPPKSRRLRFHDLPVSGKGGAPTGANITDDVAAPPAITVGAPENVTLTSEVIYASAAPQAYIQIAWEPPPTPSGLRPDRYTIQVSTNSTFTASGTITVSVAPENADVPVTRIDGLPPGVLHYVRLRAIVSGFPGDWTSMSPLVTGVNRITTAQDLSAAAQPTSLAGTWIGTGDLLLTWTNPTSANVKEVEIKIYASSGGTLLRTINTAAGRFLYTAAMNLQDTSGVGDPSLFIEARSRTFSNVLNNTSPPTLTTTKARPSVPTVAHSWSGETDHNGTAAADLTFTLTLSADTAKCTLSLNSQTARDIYGTVYTYPYARNVADNAAPGDPTLTYAITAVDGLGQTSSSAASGTATNEDPPTPTASLAGGATSIIVATIGGTQASDFAAYEVVWKRDGTTVATREGPHAVQHYELSAAADAGVHDWTVVVRQKDRFNQYSNTVTSSTLSFDGWTIAKFREGTSYRDNLGTAAATLDALKDDNKASGGITYPA